MIFKFFLHIDKDEQLRRFQKRQEDPLKNYKLTPDDWRNREKWDESIRAINDMLVKTDTEHAKWTVVEADHKKFARVKVLETIVNTLEKELK